MSAEQAPINRKDIILEKNTFLSHFVSLETFNVSDQRELKNIGTDLEKQIDQRAGTHWGMLVIGPMYRMASKINLLHEPREHVYMSRNMDIMRALVKIGFEVGSPSDLGYVRDDISETLDRINFTRQAPYNSNQNIEDQRRLDQQTVINELLHTGIAIRGIVTSETLSEYQKTEREIPEAFREFIQDLPLEDL